MKPRYKKILRDLWSNRSRTVLVTLAIAVGVLAFGSVFTTEEILLKDMSVQYKAIIPSSVRLSIPGGFSDDLIRFMESQPHIEVASGRTSALVRIYTPDGPRNMNVDAVGNLEETPVNKVTLVSGDWPVTRKQIAIEKTALPLLGKDIGDELEVELSNGKTKILTISGVVHDLKAVPANLFPQLSGYIAFSTLPYLESEDTYTQLLLVTDSSITTREEAQTLGNTLKKQLEKKGYTGVGVSAENPGKHWGEDPIKAFITIFTVIGSFSLILSIFLVINTMTALLSQQRKQIGIMKAIGAKGAQLIGLYLCMALLYGFLALGFAVPVGSLLSYWLLSLITSFLNISILNFHIPLSVFCMEAGAALVVPLIAALIPVLIGIRITAREAIYDTGSSFKNGKIMRFLQRVRFLPRPIMLSLRNTFRQKGRLIMTLVTLTVAGMLFVSVIEVRTSMFRELDHLLDLYNYDLELFFNTPYDQDTVLQKTKKTRGVQSVEAPYQLSGGQILRDKSKGKNVALYGMDPATDFMIPTVTSGRWIKDGDTNGVVISSKLVRDDPTLAVGRQLEIEINEENKFFEIIGIYSLLDERAAVVHRSYIDSLYGGASLVPSVRVRFDRSIIDPETGAKNLENDMKRSGFDVAYSLGIATIRQSSEGQFSFMIFFLLIMAAMVAVVGGLGLAGTMSLNVMERTREFGVMRSIGASNKILRKIVIVEGVTIGVLSWLCTIPLSVPMGWGFSIALGNAFFEKPLDFIFSPSGVALWLLIVVIISIFASLAPMAAAARLTIRETLAYE